MPHADRGSNSSEQSNGISGQVALVTGGGSGIGRGICHELAGGGASVLVVDISVAGAEETARQLIEAGHEAHAIQLDVTDSKAIRALRERLVSEGRMPGILANNAAIFEMAPLGEIDVASWDRMIAVNLKGPFLMMQAFLAHMLRQEWGRIISISSTAGKTGSAFASHYCAAKRGLIALSQAVALEAAPHVSVNCVCPGFVETQMTKTETEFWRTTDRFDSEDAAREGLRRQIPMERLGRPEDIARAVHWLSLPQSGYITGQAINVDGGLEFH